MVSCLHNGASALVPQVGRGEVGGVEGGGKVWDREVMRGPAGLLGLTYSTWRTMYMTGLNPPLPMYGRVPFAGCNQILQKIKIKLKQKCCIETDVGLSTVLSPLITLVN